MRTFLRAAPARLALAALVSVACHSKDDAPRLETVGVLEDLEIPLQMALDPASVNADTVRLTAPNPYGPDDVPFTVRYDADRRTVVVDPTWALAYAKDHRVVLDGLRAIDGNAVPPTEKTFRTVANPMRRWTSHRDSFMGESTFNEDYDNDALGRVTAGVATYQEGTASPQISYHFTISYADDGTRTLRSYEDPGPDKKWMTPDDLLFAVQQWQYDASGDATDYTCVNVGPDHKFGTADDAVSSGYHVERDAQGNRTFYLSSTFGEVDWVAHYVYRDDGRVARREVYDAAGEDGVWLTADDRLMQYEVPQDFGTYSEYTRYSASGSDGVWFTADDVFAGTRRYDFNSDRQTLEYTVTNAQSVTTDLWYTELDAQGNRVREWQDPVACQGIADACELEEHVYDTTL